MSESSPRSESGVDISLSPRKINMATGEFTQMSLFRRVKQKETLYANSTLRGGATKFRLIQLNPGLWDQPVTCSLHETPLGQAPPYTALSYAWHNGTTAVDSDDKTVECNGLSVHVSSNLYAALRRLRDTENPVPVWVDSICINQEDDRERTHQVQMMRDIYQRSDAVAIWLGEGAANEDMDEDIIPLPTEDSRPCLDWYGDGRDKQLWDAFIQRQKARQGIIDMKTRDIFGAFCVLWLLWIGVEAKDIMHLRHISQSTTILNGLDTIGEQSWVRSSNPQ